MICKLTCLSCESIIITTDVEHTDVGPTVTFLKVSAFTEYMFLSTIAAVLQKNPSYIIQMYTDWWRIMFVKTNLFELLLIIGETGAG